MPEQEKTKKRSNIIIDSSFQYRYFLYCLAMTVVLLMLFSGIMLIIITRLSGWWASHLIIEELVRLLVSNGVFILLTGISFGIYALFISHRIAGPAYRLEMNIREMLKGHYAHTIKLRPKDYLGNIAKALEELSEKLKAQDKLVAGILENTLKLKKLLEKERPQLKNVVDKIIEDIEKLKLRNKT